MQYDDIFFSETLPSPFSIEVGKRINQARIDAGMSQAALAEAISRSRPAISQMENGKMEPDASTLMRLALVLNKPISFFFPRHLTSKTMPDEKRYLDQEEVSLIDFYQKIIAPEFRALMLAQMQLAARYDRMRNLSETHDELWEAIETISDMIPEILQSDEVQKALFDQLSSDDNLEQIEPQFLGQDQGYSSELEFHAFKQLRNRIYNDLERAFMFSAWETEFHGDQYMNEIEAIRREASNSK